MAYELYGSIRSGSLAVELTLAEIGVAYEVHAIDLRADAQRDAAYTLVNPQQKLPALRTPEGDLLTESVAIMLTLDERHPDAGLLPAPATAERAVALRWLLFIATELYPVVEINDYPERFTAPGANASATRQLARELWRRRWLMVEQQFGGAPYFLASGEFAECGGRRRCRRPKAGMRSHLGTPRLGAISCRTADLSLSAAVLPQDGRTSSRRKQRRR